jgi:hypothetical protein
VDLPYSTLLKLIAAGVIFPVFDSGLNFPASALYEHIRIGTTSFVLRGLTVDRNKQENFRTLGLTPAGSELRRIVPFESNAKYLEIFSEYMGKRYAAVVEVLPERNDNPSK